VSDEQILTMDAVREWVGDFEIGKGRPYAESAAVAGTVRRGNELCAVVKGTRRRPYSAVVELCEGQVKGARCSCPVGTAGKCKHVAAVLLAYLDEPTLFVPVPDRDANLHARTRTELIALVRLLLRRAPELLPVLAEPLPGFPGPRPDADLYRLQARDAIRAANPHDEHAGGEVAEGLAEVLEAAEDFVAVGEPRAASAVYDGVAAALRSENLRADWWLALKAKLPESQLRALAERLQGHIEGRDDPPPF
jgi:uncharacterized Zn finger protein